MQCIKTVIDKQRNKHSNVNMYNKDCMVNVKKLFTSSYVEQLHNKCNQRKGNKHHLRNRMFEFLGKIFFKSFIISFIFLINYNCAIHNQVHYPIISFIYRKFILN